MIHLKTKKRIMSNLSLRHTAHEGFDQNLEAADIKDASVDGVKNVINTFSEIEIFDRGKINARAPE